MSRLIAVPAPDPVDAAECLARAEASGVDARDPDALASLAPILAGLAADRGLVARHAVAALKAGGGVDAGGYGAQVLLLAPPGERFLLRAALWPGPGDAPLADSGDAAFFYGAAHDHDFAFLTCGHAGPGYSSDEWQVDPDAVSGVPGERVPLVPLGRHRLAPGDVRLYRAHADIHAQIAPESFSVSINLLAREGGVPWRPQYRYDTAKGCVAAELGTAPAALLIEIAAALGEGDGLDLAAEFAAQHREPSLRIAAWRALRRSAPMLLRPLLARRDVAADRRLSAHARAIATELEAVLP